MPKQKTTPIACRDFITVRPCDENSHSKTKSAIFIPDTAKDPDNPECGIVVGVGCGLIEGGQIIPLKVQEGDHITFPRNSGTLRKNDPDWDYTTVFVLRENQVFWRVPKE